MASETVDPIDWPFPSTLTGQYHVGATGTFESQITSAVGRTRTLYHLNTPKAIASYADGCGSEKEKEKMFIQIKSIWYYNIYIHKLKLAIDYFDQNITVTPHAEKVSMFTRQISDTRLSLLW